MEGEETGQTLMERLLELESIDKDLYRGSNLWKPRGERGVFGGHVVGQSLAACVRTVPEDRTVHSFHSYFLLPADNSVPMVYTVKQIRNGQSFSTRYCLASQRGRVVFVCMVSFQRLSPETPQVRHQLDMSTIIPPEQAASEEDLLNSRHVPEKLKTMLRQDASRRRLYPVEMRYVTQPVWIKTEDRPAKQSVWIRAKGSVDEGADRHIHHCIGAYMTDFLLLGTSLIPHQANRQDVAMMASLDHSIWFHAPFKADEWLLYEMESPRYENSRGFALGRVYSRDGCLVMSTAQEGVVRLKPEKVDEILSKL